MLSGLHFFNNNNPFMKPTFIAPAAFCAFAVALASCAPKQPEYAQINLNTIHCSATLPDGNAIPDSVNSDSDLTIKLTPVLPGFEPKSITVRYGAKLCGPQEADGVQQWQEAVIDAAETATIPAEYLSGKVLVTAEFAETPESEWTYIWGEEFDGEQVDTTKWNYCGRGNATWTKNLAQGDEIPFVNEVHGGKYNSYAFATPEAFKETEERPMITGGIETRDKFAFRGGRVEARLRTRPHTGNFPAFWLMPQERGYEWPACGEIDVWEQIDDSTRTFHTVHDGWHYKTFGDISREAPQQGGFSEADGSKWHVYALEWDSPNSLKWYLDGKHVFTYENQNFTEGKYTADVTWPFNKPYYIILNQSVGEGVWAAPFDPDYEYLTEFDYVRVYQKKGELDYYSPETGNIKSEK